MSLNVYLIQEGANLPRYSSGIFVRENGQTKEISEEEWNERYPGREPVKIQLSHTTDKVYAGNITHNLGSMAAQAGIYQHLWRPEELNINKASQLIAPLQEGLDKLVHNREFYEQFNPKNGWGNYDGLVKFVNSYLEACKSYPDAEIEISR